MPKGRAHVGPRKVVGPAKKPGAPAAPLQESAGAATSSISLGHPQDVRAVDKLLEAEVGPAKKPPGPLPYHPTKDGISAFSALAGFAVAQSVAVTAVAKNGQHEVLVISVYAITVMVTSVWIAAMLCATKTEQGITTRAFDQPSIRYGRWTFAWTMLVGLIMVYLGVNKLLPNQTHRVTFTNYPVELTASPMNARPAAALASVGGTPLEREAMDKWLAWLAVGTSTMQPQQPVPAPEDEDQVALSPSDPQLFWIEQKGTFKEHHLPFSASISYDRNKYALLERVAFLVRGDAGSTRPSYRQMKFQLNSDNDFTDVLELADIEPGEAVVVLAYVSSKTGVQIPSDAFSLRSE